MKDYFYQNNYIGFAIQELGLTPDDVNKINTKYQNYGKDLYAIPMTIWMEPTPYSPIRLNRKTFQFYVPNKAKLVATIRNLILQQLGPECFLNKMLPIYTETIIQTNLYIPTPKSFSKEAVYLAESKILRPIVTPDIDNVKKIINDAVKSFIIYDDAQMIGEYTDKFYSLQPRMEVVVYYNKSPLEIIHPNIIEKRRETWNKKLAAKPEPKILQHLRKSLNT